MKGFILIHLKNDDEVLINTSKIRTIAKTADGCRIALEEFTVPTGVKGLLDGVVGEAKVVNIDLDYKFSNRVLFPTQGFEEICAMVEAAQQ